MTTNNSAPERIHLQWNGDGKPDDDGNVYDPMVTWSRDRVYEHDVEYVRADRIAALEAARAAEGGEDS